MDFIAENLQSLHKSITNIAADAGRNPADIKLIAVSKTRTLNEVARAYECGQLAFGENTMQDALSKIPEFANKELQWHFIGHLQSKKCKDIPGHFQWLHSIDSLKLVEKLSAAMQKSGETAGLNCLIQLNLSDEATKSGIKDDELDSFMEKVLKNNFIKLSWRGLMVMGVQGDMEKTRTIFAHTRALLQDIRDKYDLTGFDQLSMGMSSDYKIAIEEGSTMLRLGTAIFGERKARAN